MSSSRPTVRRPTRPAGAPEPRSALQPLRTSYALGAWLTRAAPVGVRGSVAAFGGRLWWAADAGRRRHALANYAAVLGLPEDHPEVRRVARRAVGNYGRMPPGLPPMGSPPPHHGLAAGPLGGGG